MRTRTSAGRRLAALVPVLVATSVLAAPAAHAARPNDGGTKGHSWDASSVDARPRPVSGHSWDKVPGHSWDNVPGHAAS
jgi:hypothetical protein